MNRLTKTLLIMGLALCACTGKEKNTGSEDAFRYTIDQFADLKVMRYRIPGWEQLLSLIHI